jgi:hypothetical protein
MKAHPEEDGSEAKMYAANKVYYDRYMAFSPSFMSSRAYSTCLS